MKRNPEILRVVLFAVIGALLIYAVYKCSQPVKEIVKEKQRVHLFGTFE